MKTICYLLMLLALSSCVRDVVLDAQEDPLLAVYCVIKVDSVQELKLSYAKSAAMTEAPRVTGATAVLTDLTEGREAGRFAQVSDSLWRLDYSAIPTHTYRLEVTTPGSEPVWAEQTMPVEPQVESADINSLTPEDVPWLGNLDIAHLIPWAEDDFSFEKEPRKVGFFYRFLSSGTTWVYTDRIVYDRFPNPTSYQILFDPDSYMYTDYPYVDDINNTGHVLNKVDETVSDERFPLVGVSYLSDVSFYRGFLRFPYKEDWSQSYFAISYSAQSGGFMNILTTSHLYFAALSEDYERYLLDAYQQYYAEQSDDLSSIYVRDNLHGNIHGGVGIFGAANEKEMPYDPVRLTLFLKKN
ncbi:MAG: DUF4249 family protein [Bacteroidales bacterium]|nr:DUF4249 family protein [Bacteroidales bacterium]